MNSGQEKGCRSALIKWLTLPDMVNEMNSIVGFPFHLCNRKQSACCLSFGPVMTKNQVATSKRTSGLSTLGAMTFSAEEAASFCKLFWRAFWAKAFKPGMKGKRDASMMAMILQASMIGRVVAITVATSDQTKASATNQVK